MTPPETTTQAYAGAAYALVLAGARASGDPLCDAEGVTSKAVIEIGGAPMLSHVMRSLTEAGLQSPVWVLGGEDEDLTTASGGVAHRGLPAAGAGPAASLLEALRGPVAMPLLVTTADHPLLTPEMVRHFLTEARAAQADICIGFATKEVISAAHPETRRTYLPFGSRNLSGCNLFYVSGDHALRVLELWREVEQDRKKPWRIARKLGLLFLVQLYVRRGDNATFFARLSKRLGADIRPVILPFAEAAIDVDSPQDLQLVRTLFDQRTTR